MSFSMRVIVPSLHYVYFDDGAQESVSGGCRVGRMNDGTQAFLCGPTIWNIVKAYEAGEITFNDDGSLKSMDLA